MADSTCDKCETNEYSEVVIDHNDNNGMPIQLCEECLENEIVCPMPCTRCGMQMLGDGMYTNNKTKCFCLGCTIYLTGMIDDCINATANMRCILFPDDEILTKSHDYFMSSVFSVADGVRNHRNETCYFDGTDYNAIEFVNEVSDDPKYAILHELLKGYFDYLVKNDLLLK